MNRDRVSLFVALALLLGTICCSQAHADSSAEDEDSLVTPVTSQTINSFISNPHALLFFYIPTQCIKSPFCTWQLQQFEDVAEKLLKFKPPVHIGTVDMTAEPEIAKQYNIKTSGSALLFQNGQSSAYTGPFRGQAMINQFKTINSPALESLLSLSDVLELITKDTDTKTAIIGFFPATINSSPSPLYTAYQTIANKLKYDYNFGKVVGHNSLNKKYGIPIGSETIVVFVNGEQIRYEEKDPKNLETFIRNKVGPSVWLYESKGEPVYEGRKLPLIKYYMTVKNQDMTTKYMKYYTNRLGKVVKEYKGYGVFLIADRTIYSKQIENYNIKKSENVVVIENEGKKYVYPMIRSKGNKSKKGEDYVDVEGLILFLDKFFNQQIRPWARSEKEPTKNDGPIKTVVGSTFYDMIAENKKNVFVQFTAPWCNECKTFETKYKKLATQFSEHKDIIFTKFDTTSNDYDNTNWSVSKYPTFYFKPAGRTSKPIKYEGEMEIKQMTKFIKKNAVLKKKSPNSNNSKKNEKKGKEEL